MVDRSKRLSPEEQQQRLKRMIRARAARLALFGEPAGASPSPEAAGKQRPAPRESRRARHESPVDVDAAAVTHSRRAFATWDSRIVPHQETGASDRQTKILESIEGHLRRLRQLAEARQPQPAVFAEPAQ